MSWSFNSTGTPETVEQELDTQNTGLTGFSKEEWDAAKPHLLGLVRRNIGGTISLSANGHAIKSGDADNRLKESTCQVTLLRSPTVEPSVGVGERNSED